MNPLVVLTVAATDSGGAAGVAADLITIAALGAHGACALTAVTAQDTTGVREIHALPVGVVSAQIDAVYDDLPVSAMKAGMLGSPEVAELLVQTARAHRDVPLVVDPVLAATSGAVLASGGLIEAYRELVLPAAAVVTPNPVEARRLAPDADPDDPIDLARALHRLGPAVVLTGGAEHGTACRDIVVDPSGAVHELVHPRVDSVNDHGTGCTHSAALAVQLARGTSLPTAAVCAADHVRSALSCSSDWTIGRGRGPVGHAQPTYEETT